MNKEVWVAMALVMGLFYLLTDGIVLSGVWFAGVTVGMVIQYHAEQER